MATAKKTTKSIAGAPVERAERPALAPAESAIFSMDGTKVGTIALPKELFGMPWRSDLVHQVALAMQANKRQNRAHTKDRSEVSGSGKRPWKQKGTGQARHSSRRSPLWRHGGVTFGPRNDRDYSEKINRKMRAGALASILSRKAKDGEIILVDKLSFAAPKTAEAKNALTALAKGAASAPLASKKRNAAIFALADYDANAIKSFRNINSIMTEEVRCINPVDILAHKYLVIENPETAFATLLSRVKSK